MFIITLISKYLFQLFIDRGRLSYRLHDNFSFRIDKYLCRESGNPIKFYHITNLPVLVIQNLGPGHLILLNSLQPNFPGIGSVFLGWEALQGPHQDPQKSNSTYFPLRFAKSQPVPENGLFLFFNYRIVVFAGFIGIDKPFKATGFGKKHIVAVFVEPLSPLCRG